MDLTNKKRISMLDQKAVERIVMRLSQAETDIRLSAGELTDTIVYTQITHIVENVYRLGRVQGIYEVFGGYVNRSFGIIVENNGQTHDYFVRKYKPGISDSDIRVEHGLILYAAAHGMQSIADVYVTPEGKTFFRMDEIREGKRESRAFAIYKFLDGEDRYNWINTKMTPEEDRSFGELLAEFHACTAGFDPGAKAELPIIPLVSSLTTQFPHRCDVLSPANRFRLLWEKELDHVLQACSRSWEYLSRHEKELPVANCHCDFHPGNVKWKGSKCCGLFDLDWAKLDKRLFDVVYALIYIVFSWDSENNGDIDMDRVVYMLRGYEQELRRRDSDMPPLTEAEWRALPYMFLAGIIYLLNWCMTYCDDNENLNEYEYYFYLSHTLNALSSIERRWGELEQMESRVHA